LTRLRFLPLVLAVFLAACGTRQTPAPVTVVDANTPVRGRSVTARAGDTVYELARTNGVSVRDFIDANNLQPPYELREGLRLVIPAPEQYTVQRGDTLYGLSRQFGVGTTELARYNNLDAPYRLSAGQVLRIPSGSRPEVQSADTSAPADGGVTPRSAARSRVEVVPSSGAASAPAQSTPPRASASRVETVPATPAPTAPAPAPQASSQPTSSPFAAPPTPSRPPTRETAAAPAQSNPPARVPQAAPSSEPPTRGRQDTAASAAPAAPARAGTRFAWPLRGQILSDYGPKPDGLHNDGINIAAPAGASVAAADNGVVAYAGNELRGFGNLVLIRHADGWMTAYAHLDEIKVERNQRVTRGQAIGTVGQSGGVTSPQLHFEVRRGSRAVNPMEHMDGQRAS